MVACPLFKVSGDGLEEPTGWLGAAAADLACERAQDLLGGASNRALGPADLGGLPRDARDVGVTDPFSAADMGGRIDAAAQATTARIVGTVVKQPRDYIVDVILRARDGRDVAHATGRGERDTARKLATAALAKWQTADEDVPAARDMRALLARLDANANAPR